MRFVCFFSAAAIILAAATGSTAEDEGPHQATGIKIGEVTTTSAIIWTRLTQSATRVGPDAPVPEVKYKDADTGELREETGPRATAVPIVTLPNGATVDTLEGAVPGAAGEVRVSHRAKDSDSWISTEWLPVDPNRDFTRHVTLTNLKPATRYFLRVASRAVGGQQETSEVLGEFTTAPTAAEPASVTFTVVSCQEYNDRDALTGFRMYPAMLKLKPAFMVHTGDILYYDNLAKTEDLARWHWERMYSLPTNVDFHRQVPAYFMKDDHDTWMNDCWPAMKSPFMGEFTFQQGLGIFLEQVPMSEKTYRTFRWGKDLQIWMVEGRDYRTPNDEPDGPGKTIWGAAQKAWFKKTVAESDATFRVLISPTPVVGPDRSAKNDNHANAGFQYEGEEIRAFMAEQKNMVVACGDRHWQYVSVDPVTGLREYSCGAASDAHAGGWPKDEKRSQHEYLNVIGGFLSITVEREDDVPVLIARHHSVDGAVLNEDRVMLSK